MVTKVKTKAVHVNTLRVGKATAGDWDDAMRVIAEFCEAQYGEDVAGQWNNFTQRRVLCLDYLASIYGLKTFPMLTKDNSYETDDAMVVIVEGLTPPQPQD